VIETIKRIVRGSPLGPYAGIVYSVVRGDSIRDAVQGALYDMQTERVMRRVLQRDSNCVDLGAHKGAILADMLKLAPEGQHIAFEPLPQFAARLRHRFPQATIIEAAVADAPGESEFVHVRNEPAFSGLREREYETSQPALDRISVRVTTIDDEVPADRPIALIKIDIEGGEYHALLGATETLRRWRPVVVFEASARSTGKYGVEPEQMHALLMQLGYRVSTMKRWLSGGPDIDAVEFRGHWVEDSEYYYIAYPA
jgi:FkbM family methyltransferase